MKSQGLFCGRLRQHFKLIKWWCMWCLGRGNDRKRKVGTVRMEGAERKGHFLFLSWMFARKYSYEKKTQAWFIPLRLFRVHIHMHTHVTAHWQPVHMHIHVRHWMADSSILSVISWTCTLDAWMILILSVILWTKWSDMIHLEKVLDLNTWLTQKLCFKTEVMPGKKCYITPVY